MVAADLDSTGDLLSILKGLYPRFPRQVRQGMSPLAVMSEPRPAKGTVKNEHNRYAVSEASRWDSMLHATRETS